MTQATDYGRGTKALPAQAVPAEKDRAPKWKKGLAPMRRVRKQVKSVIGSLVEKGAHLKDWVWGVSVSSKKVIDRLRLPSGPTRINEPEREGESSLLLLEFPKGELCLGH